MYIPPFSRLSRCIRIDEESGIVTMPADIFKKLLKALAADGGCDPEWYSSAYQDLAQASQDEAHFSPLHHFSDSGYFEGRRPRAFYVDEAWYLERYQDVYLSIKEGKVASGHAHFNATGYFEGRVPAQAMEDDIEEWNTLVQKHSQEPITKQREREGEASKSIGRRR